MGTAAERNHWGRDEGCGVDVAHVRRLAEAGGFWAVVPCQDAALGRIRHEALRYFGCLVFWGRSSAGDDLDVLVPLASAKAGARFLAFLESLRARFSMPSLLYGEGFDKTHLTAQVRCTFATWDGSVVGLAEIYADLRGLDGFELQGSCDTSVMRRFAESRRPFPGP